MAKGSEVIADWFVSIDISVLEALIRCWKQSTQLTRQIVGSSLCSMLTGCHSSRLEFLEQILSCLCLRLFDRWLYGSCSANNAGHNSLNETGLVIEDVVTSLLSSATYLFHSSNFRVHYCSVSRNNYFFYQNSIRRDWFASPEETRHHSYQHPLLIIEHNLHWIS